MRFDSLDAWLSWLEQLHPRTIDLGLERVRHVARALGLGSLPCPVVTVGGTNGKGSSVAMLEAILAAAGYRVAVYTSPHLLRYNERIRIGGREAGDDELCQAFERVDQARGGTSLTYFEFGTLAALDLFARAAPDAAILEVGMGGRLDAVNVMDSDVALLTSISIDHIDWLGSDRESIGGEKAGIFRRGRASVCADPDPPQTVLRTASMLGTILYRAGHEFGYHLDGARPDSWSWWGPDKVLAGLPVPGLAGRFQYRNAAGVLMVTTLLQRVLAIPVQAIEAGLAKVRLAGRFQCLPGTVLSVFDVAHNVGGAEVLAQTLAERKIAGRTRAVAAMLGDKDIDGMISSMAGVVDAWYIAGLAVERGAPASRIRDSIAAHAPGNAVTVCEDVLAAYRAAQSASSPGDRIVVFGSFYTVGAILRAEQRGVVTADD